MSAEYRDPHSRFILTEKLNNVGLIEAYNMFGMTPRYSRTYIFDTNGVTLKIDKAMLLNQLMINYIAKINMLNTTCNQYHQTLKLLRDFPEDTVQDKITKFILSFSSTTLTSLTSYTRHDSTSPKHSTRCKKKISSPSSATSSTSKISKNSTSGSNSQHTSAQQPYSS